MNRATKRLMAKQEAAAERERARSAPLTKPAGRKGGGGTGGGESDGRLRRWRRFLKEVRQELKKVAWPSRAEIFTYTIVVLVSVAVMTTYVFGLDFGLGKLVLAVFGE